MSDFYADMRDAAGGLLKEFTQGTVRLVRPNDSDGDSPWTSGGGDPQSYDLSATVKGVSTEYVDGTTILASDLEVTAAPVEVTPQMSDHILIDGTRYEIVQLIAIPAAGTTVVQKYIVRR